MYHQYSKGRLICQRQKQDICRFYDKFLRTAKRRNGYGKPVAPWCRKGERKDRLARKKQKKRPVPSITKIPYNAPETAKGKAAGKAAFGAVFSHGNRCGAVAKPLLLPCCLFCSPSRQRRPEPEKVRENSRLYSFGASACTETFAPPGRRRRRRFPAVRATPALASFCS